MVTAVTAMFVAGEAVLLTVLSRGSEQDQRSEVATPRDTDNIEVRLAPRLAPSPAAGGRRLSPTREDLPERHGAGVGTVVVATAVATAHGVTTILD